MGPIEKKIKEYLNKEGLSEETRLILKNLKSEVKEIEPIIINEGYHQGYSDKERGKNPTWNHFKTRYYNYISKMKFGQFP
jgi:hypothetical protein